MARWGNILSRGNVQDRRGMRSLAIGGGGLGVTGIALLLLLNALGGGNVTDILGQLNNIAITPQSLENSTGFEGNDQYEVFASTVLGSANDMWETVFAQGNKTYREPTLVLFRGITQSECGGASAAAGPHYCPLDETIYLDETFFDELQTHFAAEGGDVAEAYVIAHEVGHHVQNLLGSLNIVEQAARAGRAEANAASVKLELQADCFAGLWAHSIKHLNVFEFGEIKEAIDAAAAVGDDRIQKRTTGRINPESWTHGSSEQRVSWFNRGFESGQINACDTLSG
jgi:predicted metalloprotease